MSVNPDTGAEWASDDPEGDKPLSGDIHGTLAEALAHLAATQGYGSGVPFTSDDDDDGEPVPSSAPLVPSLGVVDTSLATRMPQTDPAGRKVLDRWLESAPRLLQVLFYDGDQLSRLQINVWSIIVGIVCGLFIAGFQTVLKYGVRLVWHTIFHALDDAGVFGEHFPRYNYNWMAVMAVLLLVGIVSTIWSKTRFGTARGLGECLEGLHTQGLFPTSTFFPMTMGVLLGLISGASVGPESGCIVMTGCIGSLIAGKLHQGRRVRRIITLCGMSAGLAAFFGLPIGAAIFVLELPHRMGIQYFDAIVPAVVSSLVATAIDTMVRDQHLGGEFLFPALPTLKWDALFLGIFFGIIGAAVGILFILYAKAMKKLGKASRLSYISLAVLCAVLTGTSAIIFPSATFWGEDEMEYVLSRGNRTLPHAKAPGVLGDQAYPLSAGTLFAIGVVKMLNVGFVLGAKIPGGILYPLFFAGASIGYALSLWMGITPTIGIMCMMGAMETAVLRTPWGTAIVLLQISRGFIQQHEGTNAIAIFPVLCMACCTSLYLSTRKVARIALYESQHDRDDIQYIIVPEDFVYVYSKGVDTFDEDPTSYVSANVRSFVNPSAVAHQLAMPSNSHWGHGRLPRAQRESRRQSRMRASTRRTDTTSAALRRSQHPLTSVTSEDPATQ